jgi:hypothetical protein
MRTLLVLLFAVVTAAPAGAESPTTRRWLRANFHAHALPETVDDDGTEKVADLHHALHAAGFDFSLHSPHCTNNAGSKGQAGFDALRASEAQLQLQGLTIAVGQELTVADGPNFAQHTTVLGRSAPGNLNHITTVGSPTLFPFRTPLGEACDKVHKQGGICIVNHPGPGPMMWEEGLWESPRNRGRIDAIEVYNGQALSAVGIEFESRYREATAYRGLGLKIAATTGADTHGPKSVAGVKAKLAGFAGSASKLLSLMLPSSESARPELDAATLVYTDGVATADVIAAIKARRTVAVYAMPNLTLTLEGLGEVRKTGDVHLELDLSRKLAEVTLYREGAPVATWHNVDHVEYSEKLSSPATYVFGARDGNGRLLTSAIWYQPPN